MTAARNSCVTVRYDALDCKQEEHLSETKALAGRTLRRPGKEPHIKKTGRWRLCVQATGLGVFAHTREKTHINRQILLMPAVACYRPTAAPGATFRLTSFAQSTRTFTHPQSYDPGNATYKNVLFTYTTQICLYSIHNHTQSGLYIMFMYLPFNFNT